MATDINTDQTADVRAGQTRTNRYFRPRVDILEQQDELILVADLPGVKSDAVEIGFEDGVLTVEGRVEPRGGERSNVLHREYGIGNFHRTFRVSKEIDANRIHAEHTGGVLTVHLPKLEKARARKVTVTGGG